MWEDLSPSSIAKLQSYRWQKTKLWDTAAVLYTLFKILDGKQYSLTVDHYQKLQNVVARIVSIVKWTSIITSLIRMRLSLHLNTENEWNEYVVD